MSNGCKYCLNGSDNPIIKTSTEWVFIDGCWLANYFRKSEDERWCLGNANVKIKCCPKCGKNLECEHGRG